MTTAHFFVADPDLLPPPTARQAARDHLAAAATAHWSATTSERPHWAGPPPRCPDCGKIVNFLPPSADGWPCWSCDRVLLPHEADGGYARFSVWLFADLDDPAREALRAGLEAAMGVPVRAARTPLFG